MKLPDAVRCLAHRQAGALSIEQLRGQGVTNGVVYRMMNDGLLRRVTRGIYALEADSWLQMVWVAVLIGGSAAVIGGRAAAYLNDLVSTQPDEIDCYVGLNVQPRVAAGPWRFIRAHRLGRGEPPRTTNIQTILDASKNMTDDEIAALIAQAGRRVQSRDILAQLAALERHPRRQALREIVGDISQGAQSALEVRYARDVERAHGLPPMVRQANITGYARLDGIYPRYGVIVEVDGRRYHAGIAARGDADRDNQHLLAGLVTMRFTWHQVADYPCEVARQVGTVLKQAGWMGLTKPCRRCRVGLGVHFSFVDE